MSVFEEYKKYLGTFMSHAEAQTLVEALESTSPVVSVRRNSRKAQSFSNAGFEPVPWCDEGVYLSERVPFTFDPLLHAGCYYVQDASSMVYERIVKLLRGLFPADRPIKYLDLCAAPGGKTTAALDALADNDFVVANEINRSRAQILVENVAKWGSPNCYVTSDDSARFVKAGEFFDIIAVDAPCSGEGMMRKDDDAVNQWSISLVEECAQRQHTIVDNAWQALAPGGYLIYSTCTFNRFENEEIISYIIDRYGPESVNLGLAGISGIAPGIDTDAFCYRFMPHRTKGEGLFVGVLHKPEGIPATKSNNKSSKPSKPMQLPPIVNMLVPEDYKISGSGDTVVATIKEHLPWLSHLNNCVKFIAEGVRMGTVKGKDFIPFHAFAMNKALVRGVYEEVDVDYPTAISYLRSEGINLPAEQPRGIVLLCYRGCPIGFVKNLGNRANSLMQKEWRIRSSYIPDFAPDMIKFEI